MKLLTGILLPLILLLTASCEPHHGINGDLDGNWQLLTVDRPDGGQRTFDAVYYSFMMHSFNIYDDGAYIAGGGIEYDSRAGTLVLDVVSANELQSVGIPLVSPCKVDFDIKKLTKQSLVMTHGDNVFTFRKF